MFVLLTTRWSGEVAMPSLEVLAYSLVPSDIRRAVVAFVGNITQSSTNKRCRSNDEKSMSGSTFYGYKLLEVRINAPRRATAGFPEPLGAWTSLGRGP